MPREGGTGRTPFFVVAAAVAAVAASPARAQDAAAREWTQPRADAARTGYVDLEPVRAQPEIAWRRDLPGAPTCSPVVWSGTIFAAARNAKGEVTLVAVRASTGAEVASRPLGKAEWVDLVTVSGAVIAVDPTNVRCFRFDGEKFSVGWNMKGTWAGQPAVARGALFLADASSVHVLDPQYGRPLIPPVLVHDSSEPHDFAATCVTRWTADEVLVSRLQGTGSISTARVSGLGTKKVSESGGNYVRSPFNAADSVTDRSPRNAILAMLGRSWLATYSKGFFAKGDANSCGSVLVDITESGYRYNVWRAPAMIGETAYGMTHDSAAIAVHVDGKFTRLTPEGALPKGARSGTASAARGVVFFGNWAMEVASGRVLWCLPELDPITPLVPVSDGLGVCVNSKSALVCVAEPGRLAAAAAGDATQAAAQAPPALPGDADGALLADGRFVAGVCSPVAPGRLKIVPSAGDALDLAPAEWALAQSGGRAVAVSEERAVLAALDEILDARSASAWDAVVRKYAEVPLVTDAQRALAAARRDGLSEFRARQLEKSLLGKRDHPNADLQRRRVGPEERALRDVWLEDVRSASRWCRARGLVGAAAALLSRVRAERPADDTTATLAREALPAGFPWAKAADAGQRWIDWAREIVPAGGEFVPDDSPEAKATRAPPWDRDVLLLRTRNVLFVARTNDPKVLGPCLRHAEGAVRACEQVLGPPAPGAPAARLEVRLHPDRAAYLGEVTPTGGRAREWSNGYFSPTERVSRFYVPSSEEIEATPLERSLLSVLAHELTHHWVEMRWTSGDRCGPLVPGYWCVEGIAVFVANQSVEMGRRQGRLDDATVESLDIASQLDGQGGLFPVATLVAMSHAAMHGLDEEPKTKVQMRYRARFMVVDPRAAFYQESGALVFWLLQRRGDEGRKAFADYLRARYQGRSPTDASAALGFESAAEMDREFRKFLASLRR